MVVGAIPETSTRGRLLFLSHNLPFPPDTGAKSRTFNTLRLLGRHFEVTALCFFRAETMSDSHPLDVCERLREFAAVEAFAIPQDESRLRFIWDHVRSATSRRVYTTYAYRSRDFENRLRHHLSQPWDVVHVDSIDLSHYLPMVIHLPVVVAHHAVESVLLQRRADHESSFLRRRYLAFQSHLLQMEERSWCPRVAVNIAVSELDRELFKTITPGRFEIIPNGVDTDRFTSAPGGSEGCLFLGSSSWLPNLDGMKYFATEIFHLLKQLEPSVTVTWIGKVDEVETALMNSVGIQTPGHVPDIRPYLAKVACCIVPLRVGGGTRIKILEAWAAGKAVVSTALGCEGLDATDGENILIRDDPPSFAEAIGSVLHDGSLRRRLGENGRMTAENTYNWNVLSGRMISIYSSLFQSTH